MSLTAEVLLSFLHLVVISDLASDQDGFFFVAAVIIGIIYGHVILDNLLQQLLYVVSSLILFLQDLFLSILIFRQEIMSQKFLSLTVLWLNVDIAQMETLKLGGVPLIRCYRWYLQDSRNFVRLARFAPLF